MASVSELLAPMLDAAKASLGEDWPKARDFAKLEFQKLARTLLDITKLVVEEKVNEQQARALFMIHRNTTLTVLLTIEGLGVIAVENAINAALDAVRKTINTGIGFALL